VPVLLNPWRVVQRFRSLCSRRAAAGRRAECRPGHVAIPLSTPRPAAVTQMDRRCCAWRYDADGAVGCRVGRRGNPAVSGGRDVLIGRGHRRRLAWVRARSATHALAISSFHESSRNFNPACAPDVATVTIAEVEELVASGRAHSPDTWVARCRASYVSQARRRVVRGAAKKRALRTRPLVLSWHNG